jgi:hypothetical protein
MALPSNELNDLLFHTFVEDDDGKVALRVKGVGSGTGAEADTLDTVTGRGNTTTNDITVNNATVNGDLTIKAGQRVYLDG